MKENDVEKAKKIIENFDPALVALAVREISMEAQRVEKGDVEKAREKIKEIYESLPATKDRAEIISKALEEVDTEVIGKEIENIKTELKDFDKAVLLEASKDLEIIECCLRYYIGCGYRIGCLHRCLRYYIGCGYRIGCLHRCLRYYIGCGYRIGCGFSIGCTYQMHAGMIEEIVREVLENPELSRALKKMITEIKKKGEL